MKSTKNPSKPDISIIVPCFNEEDNVREILDDIKKIMQKQHFLIEVILVDDMSQDKTYKIATKWADKNKNIFPIQVIQRFLDRRGYGAVVRYGTAYASGRYCIFVAADGVDPINLIPKMYAKMEKGASLVQVSRYMKKGDDKTIPFAYKFSQFFFRLFVKVIFGKFIPDTTYAFKMFDRKTMLGVGLTQNKFSISPEITFKCLLMEKKIVYFPAAQGVRKNGVSKFNFLREGPGYGYCLIRSFLHKNRIFYWF